MVFLHLHILPAYVFLEKSLILKNTSHTYLTHSYKSQKNKNPPEYGFAIPQNGHCPPYLRPYYEGTLTRGNPPFAG